MAENCTRRRKEAETRASFGQKSASRRRATYDAPDGTVSLKVVLDTTSANWTAQWFVNDVSVRGPVAYDTNPTDISWVGIGKFGAAGGMVEDYVLQAVTPVPEHWEFSEAAACCFK